MKASELRIGNLIMWDSEKTQIEIISEISKGAIGLESDTDFDTLTPIGLFKPIWLTEEWLMKLGFEKLDENTAGCIWVIVRNDIVFDDLKITQWYKPNRPKFERRHFGIKYVHQLQNLYFALTGEELEIITP